MAKKRIHILSNTHWDREWRFPFEETRLHLVKLVDRLLEIMENIPEYKYFNFDSQTIFLEDYLELRPENRPRLEKLISEGRLVVGPWYTLPEEHCVGEESLVRNLLMGKKIADSFGKCSKAGYTPTSYGQISQMAQLYAGFGIDGIIFYRGIDSGECTQEYFLEAPDGSQIMGIRLSRFVSRGAFYLYVSARTMHEKNWQGFRWGDEGCLPVTLNRVGEDHEEEPHIFVSPYRKKVNLDVVEDGINQAMEDILAGTTTNVLVLMDGMDSVYPNENLPQIIEKANQVNEDWEFIHSSLPEFISDLKKNICEEKMTILKGERRHPSISNKFNAFLKDSISSRMYIKQANAISEKSILKWAEPFSLINKLLNGTEYPQKSITKAWKYLLSSHSHDSIGGLSPDQIHKDMMHRFEQVQIIGKALSKDALGQIISCIDTSDANPEDLLITVFNPLPYTLETSVNVYADLPREQQYRGYYILDPEGNKVTRQTLSREDNYLIATEPNELPMTFNTTKWQIAFHTGILPALGFKTFTLKPRVEKTSNHGTLVCKSNEMENEYLRVKINSNGTIDVVDKQTGEIYSNLMWFEDSGEWGDPWTRYEAIEDRVYNSMGNQVQITLINNGPVITTYEITMSWELPAGIDHFSKKRTESHKNITIKANISLKKGVRQLLIDLEIDNQLKYHRLRAMFDSGFLPNESIAHGQFDVLRRNVKLSDTSDWLEPVTGTNPYYGFITVENGIRGMAVISDGLTEYEVSDNESGTICITLLRAFGYPRMSGLLREDRVVREGNEGSQCPGLQKFNLSLYFYKGLWQDSTLLQEEASRRNPPYTTQHGRFEGKMLSTCESFFSLEPANLCLTCIKPSEDGTKTVFRFYNPTMEKINGKLWSKFPIKSAALVKLDETYISDMPFEENYIRVEVSEKKIVTIAVDWKA